MGKGEKIVVLGFLFVIVIILVVSLDRGQGGDVQGMEREGADPTTPDEGRTAADLTERAPGGPAETTPPASADPGTGAVPPAEGADATTAPPGPQPDREPTKRPAGVLLAAEHGATPVYEVPEEIPSDWALRTLDGLTDHLFDPTHKVYTAGAGDTLESVAQRYYGDPGQARLLRRANEGRLRLTEGDQILLPTHDHGLGSERIHVVEEGDSLWKVAVKVYGQGHRWEEIWEANRHQLATPDDLRTGMELVIP